MKKIIGRMFHKWSFKLYKEIQRIKFLKQYNRIVNPYYLIWVDPYEIKYRIRGSKGIPGLKHSSKRWGPDWYTVGKIADGNWDVIISKNQGSHGKETYIYPIEEWDLLKAFEERINYNKDWKDTEYFEKHFKRIENGNESYKCSDLQDIERRLKKRDKLIENIREIGYKPQRTMNWMEWHEIQIAIGRNGEMILFDGRHRYCAARALNLDMIPVILVIQHKRWFDHKRKIVKDQNITENHHPDIRYFLKNTKHQKNF